MPPKGKQFFFPDKGNAWSKVQKDNGVGAGQGWLFSPESLGASPKEEMSDEDRYPRGYTPERQREVSDAISDAGMEISAIGSKDSDLYKNIQERIQKGEITKKDAYQAVQDEKDKVRQVITRSKMPVEDIKKLGDHPKGLKPKIVGGSAGLSDSASGSYDPATNVLKLRGPVSKQFTELAGMDTTPGQAAVIVHELGHGVDFNSLEQDGTGLTRNTTGAVVTTEGSTRAVDRDLRGHGIAEGIADKYAEDYAVPDTRINEKLKNSGSSDKKYLSGYEGTSKKAQELVNSGKEHELTGQMYKWLSGTSALGGTKSDTVQGPDQWLTGYDDARAGKVKLGEIDVTNPEFKSDPGMISNKELGVEKPKENAKHIGPGSSKPKHSCVNCGTTGSNSSDFKNVVMHNESGTLCNNCTSKTSDWIGKLENRAKIGVNSSNTGIKGVLNVINSEERRQRYGQ